MSCRRHGSKTTIAFWMLVAIADAAMLAAASGITVMLLILATVALVAGGFMIARRLSRGDAVYLRGSDTREAAPAQAIARRRA